MATYRLHCFKQSGNTYKVALYLECAGLDWEPVAVDFFAGVTRTIAWRAETNEMGEAPVLEVGDRRLSQSGAILTYLAETTGKFAPESDEERYEALRWMLYDNYRFTSSYATHRFQKCFANPPPHPAALEFLKARADGAFAVVEKHLSGRAFIAADRPTIADFSLAGYIFYPREEIGYDIAKDYPSIFAWSERIKALPGWKHPYDLLPGPYVEPR
ncbi:MAG: glutathione S-transferase [Hyphomicrobium sp.]|jgi:glutathione S-transferase